jgi:hypothetical protein
MRIHLAPSAGAATLATRGLTCLATAHTQSQLRGTPTTKARVVPGPSWPSP